jgi:hypothetical protein
LNDPWHGSSDNNIQIARGARRVAGAAFFMEGFCTSLNSRQKIMKHNILSIWAGAYWLPALSLWLFLAALAHAQPGPGYALNFNNTASYVAVPQAVGLNSFPFTVMAWVHTTATSGQQGLVNKYLAGSQNGWNLFLKDGNVRAWYFASNSRFVWDGFDGLNGGSIANGQWHHIAFAVDGSGGRLYVDGVLRASREWPCLRMSSSLMRCCPAPPAFTKSV